MGDDFGRTQEALIHPKTQRPGCGSSGGRDDTNKRYGYRKAKGDWLLVWAGKDYTGGF